MDELLSTLNFKGPFPPLLTLMKVPTLSSVRWDNALISAVAFMEHGPDGMKWKWYRVVLNFLRLDVFHCVLSFYSSGNFPYDSIPYFWMEHRLYGLGAFEINGSHDIDDCMPLVENIHRSCFSCKNPLCGINNRALDNLYVDSLPGEEERLE